METNKNKKNNDVKTNEKLISALDNILETDNQDLDCSSGVCVIKGDKSLIERINKKIITEDGRQLLI
jgi:hypothetical protein